MSVLIEGAESRSAGAYINSVRDTGSNFPARGTDKVESGGFAVDFSSAAMENNAYAGHSRSVEDVIQEAENEDITARRNYMAIMSNTMSDEDFARLQEEGFHPGSTDIETVVTILDRIKVALVKGGTSIAGYTDTVSEDALKDIAGNEAFANELKRQFSERDIPLTRENITAVTEAWNLLTKAGEPSEGSTKYMIENELEPTAENLYTAKYSAVSDAGRQGKGYYAAGAVAGYYARKPEEVNFEQLRPQVERVIREAGYQVNEENLENARWLIEKGIPLNEETFSLLNEIKENHFPVTEQEFMSAAVCAISDGLDPSRVNLGRTETFMEKAAELVEQTALVEEKAADIILTRDLPLTLKNLLAVQEQIFHRSEKGAEEENLPENIHGRRLLEEVRLSMTLEASVRLLRSGFQIETVSLEKLVSSLKEAEKSFARALAGEVDESQAEEKAALYQETVEVVEGIRSSPISIVAQVYETDTLREVYAHGSGERRAYERAGQSYETMMTQPRRDMGDSIQTAFRNVDDILESMGLETSEENRRAVRILGYNSLEITEENIRQIREKDELLGNVVKEMKPGRILNMIRDEVNPLVMTLGELSNYLSQQEDMAEQMESYSRFLYKLEKKKGITQEEKSAYIGIYRLVRQIEKGDNKAVGALWQTGEAFTLGNLLKALQSSRRGAMDYSVDDQFGGISQRRTTGESITDQIAKGYGTDSVPGRQELEQILESAGDEEAVKEFNHMLSDQIRGAVKSENEILQYLADYGKPVTADHLLAAGSLLKDPKALWQELNRLKGQENTSADENPEENFLESEGGKVLEAFEGKEDAQKAYDSLQQTIQNMIERAAFSDSREALDVKAMSTLYKQISFVGSMAKEENYEIPASIGGFLTSINLKIIHNGYKESKVAVTFDTEIFGKTAAEFRLTDQRLEGLCICSTGEGADLLGENKGLFSEKLEKQQIGSGEIHFAARENLDLVKFSLREARQRQSGDDSKLLYRAAKVFIEYVQETGMKKGSQEYENQL